MGKRLEDDPPDYFSTHVFVCTNRRPEGHCRGSCAARGSEKLRDYMKAAAKALAIEGIRVNSSGCLDRCESGPCVVIYPEGVWYRIDSPAAVDRILEEHVQRGARAPDLMLNAEEHTGS